MDSIREIAESILAKEDKIDILVNNAEIKVSNKRRSLTEDGHEMHFGYNYLAHFLLTELLMPLLERSAYCGHHPRIVFIADKVYKRDKIHLNDIHFKETKYSKNGAFNQSKLANLMHSVYLHKKLEESTISVIAVKPSKPHSNNICCLKQKSIENNILFGCVEDDLNGVYYENGKEHLIDFDEEDLKRLWELSEHLLGWSSDGQSVDTLKTGNNN